MDEIAGAEDPFKLQKARKAEQPEKFHPQLATLGNDPPVGNKWIYEIKLDGYRILAFIKDKNIRLISRSGKDWTQKFFHIADALKKFPVNQAILDGEIVLLQILVSKTGEEDKVIQYRSRRPGQVGDEENLMEILKQRFNQSKG